MSVDSKVLLMFEKLRKADRGKPVADQTPAQEGTQKLNTTFLFMGNPKEVARIENWKIPRPNEGGEIPIGIYFRKI